MQANDIRKASALLERLKANRQAIVPLKERLGTIFIHTPSCIFMGLEIDTKTLVEALEKERDNILDELNNKYKVEGI